MKLSNLLKRKKKKEEPVSPSNSEKPENVLMNSMQRILEKVVDKKINVGQAYYDLLNKMEQHISEREKYIKGKDKERNDKKFLSILQIGTLSHIISSTYTGNGDKVYDEVDRGVMTKKLTELVEKMK